jgi:hypothetical protein
VISAMLMLVLPYANVAPGRRERLPDHAPLRTVRESFPSHGLGNAEAGRLLAPAQSLGANCTQLIWSSLACTCDGWFRQSEAAVRKWTI